MDADLANRDSVTKPARVASRLAPDVAERVLGALALTLLSMLTLAVVRGQPHWHSVPSLVWFHLATIALALALTPVLMWRKRGDRAHRILGWTWCVAMFATAVATFWIRGIGDGGFSWIHLLSVLTVVVVPQIVMAARAHNAQLHRKRVRGMIVGALLLAGFFTFPFDRLLGRWLFG